MHTMLKHSEGQPTTSPTDRRLFSADVLGIVVSTLCLIHCLLLPVLALALPSLGVHFLHDDSTHYFLAFFVATFCIVAVVPGYLRHNNKRVLTIMLSGLGLVLFATFAHATLGENWEMPLITAGNLLVVSAHFFNRKLLASACC